MMSCHLRGFAKIVDIPTIKKSLFFGDLASISSGESDPWDWSIDESKPDNKEGWLDECFVSLSPSGELLAIAYKKSMVILTAKWDSMEEGDIKTKYVLSWHGDPRKESNEEITSVLCLPIAAQGRQSSQSGPDWTCIAVGFTTGAIRFYTETGNLLVSEVLHNDSVVSIKCQCFQPGHESQQLEELYVNYTTVVCCLRGFSLCNTLKACRNQLARVQAKCGEMVEAPPLDQVKWSLTDQLAVNDMWVLGSSAACGFNHLATATIRGGFYTSYRSSPPHTATVIAAGTKPYVAFHCIVEGNSTPVLTDVAKAVASKLKSTISQAVPGWFGGRRSSVQDKSKEKPTLEPPDAMSCRFGLCDAPRYGRKIVMCPQRKLSAVCDSLGRVILIDNSSGTAIRMWKGYREAECGFVPIHEGKGTGRCALFLVIYAPKKGIIEVWALQQGPRVATFQVTKTGRLMYINHGLLGLSSVGLKAANCSPHPCIFFDNSGLICQVSVPFHAVFSDKNDKKVQDTHILKQMKRLLQIDPDEVKELCLQLNTDEMCEQALEMIASSKYASPDLLQFVVSKFLERFSNDESETPEDEQSRVKCMVMCDNIQKLLNFFNMVHVLQNEPPKYNTVVQSPGQSKEEELADLLRLSLRELDTLLKFISTSEENKDQLKVKFKTPDGIFPTFMSCFIKSCSSPGRIHLSTNVSSSTLASIGEIFCQCTLYGGSSIEEWKDFALESSIDPKAFLHAAVAYWLSKSHGGNLYSELTLFNNFIHAICSMTKGDELNSLWPEVRTRISSSDNPSNALTAAVVVRSVFLHVESKLMDKGDAEWETVTEESCAWSMLISQLEGIAQLYEVLSFKTKKKTDMPNVPRLQFFTSAISLSQILSKGPGSISELVARWVSSWGLPPEWLVETEAPPQPCEGTSTKGSVIDGIPASVDASSEVMPTTKTEDMVLQRIRTLREHFPQSLGSGPLIANLSWEYAVAWGKELDRIDLLQTSLQCLNAIPTPHLRQGLSSIMWNVHLRSRFEATVKLLHKVGKVPKEKLCRQDISISDSTVTPFLKYIVEFFNIFVESCEASGTAERKEVEREALWTEETQPSLAEVAIAQASPNCGLLHVLNQCATALYLLANFSLHFHRPVTNLFDSIGESCLWNEISSNPRLPSHNFEPKLQESRSKFLMKIITAALDPIGAGSDDKLINDAVNWIAHCYSLAADWSLNCEPLRKHQVCRLYLQNCDRLAEEVLPVVNDKEGLGCQLLTIAGQRMKTLLANSNLALKERMANLSPSLTLWIRQQEELKIQSDVKDIQQMVSIVASLIPEFNPDHKLAHLLLEAIQPLDT